MLAALDLKKGWLLCDCAQCEMFVWFWRQNHYGNHSVAYRTQTIDFIPSPHKCEQEETTSIVPVAFTPNLQGKDASRVNPPPLHSPPQTSLIFTAIL
jgi:hypothetical protein